MNIKKNVKEEYGAMLLRTPDIGGSFLESNLYIVAFVFSLYKVNESIASQNSKYELDWKFDYKKAMMNSIILILNVAFAS